MRRGAAFAAGLAALVATASPVAAEADAFARYPAARVATGAPRPLRLDRASRGYRTRLREAATQPADFAGGWVLAEMGCGAECLFVAAVEPSTGRVAWLKPSVCCWPDDVTEPLEHRRDSRLLLVHGRLDERGEATTHAFVLEGGRFRPVPPPR